MHSFLHNGIDYYTRPGATLNEDEIAFETGGRRKLWIQMGANDNQGKNFGWEILSIHSMELADMALNPRDAAVRAVEMIEYDLDYINDIRTTFGAYTNRLEFTKNNLDVAEVNLSTSDSRIRDTDMAKASMENMKFEILNQASITMLAQAKQNSSKVLELL